MDMIDIVTAISIFTYVSIGLGMGFALDKHSYLDEDGVVVAACLWPLTIAAFSFYFIFKKLIKLFNIEG